MTATSTESPAIPKVMEAVVLPSAGEPLEVRELRTPKPGRGEVLVKVAACGVCHTDLHVIKGEVAFPTPGVLGHEISGTVVQLGEDVPDRLGLAVGSKVVGGFIMPCGECDACVRGRDDLCGPFFALNRLKGVLFDGTTRLFDTDGEPVSMYSMGGLAEYAVVPASGLAELPDDMPMTSSAVLGCAAMTAYGAVRHGADVRVGETVAVVAMGGVGSNLVQMSRAFGAAQVIAVDISDEKLSAAEKLGATDAVNGKVSDAVAAVREATGGRGVDVAFEALGTAQTFEQAAGMLADGGRLVAVGIAAGQTAANIPITQLVRRSQRIIGSYGGRTRTDLPRVVRLAHEGILRPQDTVTKTFPLSMASSAYDALDRGEISGRAVVVIDDQEGL